MNLARNADILIQHWKCTSGKFSMKERLLIMHTDVSTVKRMYTRVHNLSTATNDYKQ